MSKRAAAFVVVLAACAVLVIALTLRLTGAGTTSRNPVTGVSGRIVFASYPKGSYDSEIFTMSADGSGRSHLVDHPSGSDPDWSPDGKEIVFSSYVAGSDDIFVMNADGTDQTNLTNNPAADESEPDWSPDGTKIVFTVGDPSGGDAEIFVMNADGSGQRNLTDGPSSGSAPAWSPDGKKVAFVSGFNTYNISVMNADGTGQTNLTNNGASEDAPNWSPDGKKILFERGDASNIFVMNADGSDQTPVGKRRGGFPAWSPDGARIAFGSLGVNGDIFVVNTDGNGRTNLTKSAGDEVTPDWNALPLPRCVVPRVVGRDLPTAGTRIRGASCAVGRVRYIRSASRRGKVVRQSLRPGTERPRGTPVSLLVVKPPAEAPAPALSKDRLSFVRGDSIFLARSDGSEVSTALHGTNSKSYFDPAWSPDGRRLAVTVESAPTGTHGYYDLYVFEGSLRRLSVPGGDSSRDGNPAWAPDGRQIVLVGYEFDAGGALYIARPSGSSRVVERNHDFEIADNEPSWSPDGSAIAFSRVASASSGLYFIKPDGTHLRRVTTTPAFNPSWSPTGRQVVFDDGRAINVINADGSGLRQLVSAGEDPAWSPDGRAIAFVRRGSIWVVDPRGAHAREVIRDAEQPTWKLES